MIVVDTNVIGYLFLTSEHSPLAEQALQQDSEWAAPTIWRSELRNVLAFYMRKDILTLESAQRVMNGALELLRGREYEASSDEVLRRAAGSTCSAYDCEFVVTADELKVPLVTHDRRLLLEFPEVAVSLKTFCEQH